MPPPADGRRDPAMHLDLLELDARRAGEPLPAAAQAHIAWCAECRRMLELLQTLAMTLHSGAPDPVPDEIEATILAQARTRARSIRRAAWRPGHTAMAAAAVAVLALGGLLLSQQPPAQRGGAGPTAAMRPALTRAESDVDGDGRITVLDAFAVARRAANDTPRRDAVAEDAGAILAMAVSLERR